MVTSLPQGRLRKRERQPTSNEAKRKQQNDKDHGEATELFLSHIGGVLATAGQDRSLQNDCRSGVRRRPIIIKAHIDR